MNERYNKTGISEEEYKTLMKPKYKYNKSKDGVMFNKLPHPRNTVEFEILSEFVFGIPLHISGLTIWNKTAQYEIKELYDSYRDAGWERRMVGKQYDLNRDFCRHVFGCLYCGGIAGHAYGQVRIFGYRKHKRLLELGKSIREGKDGVYNPRESFLRLARMIRLREEQNDSR